MANRFILLLVSSLFILLNGCRVSQESTDRDKLRFKSSVKTVSLLIHEMGGLMSKLNPPEGELINYFFNSKEELYVCSQNIGRLDSLNLNAVVFANYTRTEKKRFITLTADLKENFITDSHLEAGQCYFYSYRPIKHEGVYERRIIVLNEAPCIELMQGYLSLDNKEGIHLMRHRNLSP